jgi:phenylalanyl-tRNA synthetase alpha chain
MTEVCEAAILNHLSSSEAIEDTLPWSEASNLDHLAVVGAVKSLLADDYVSSTDLSTNFCTLTKEAEQIVANGSQEIIVLQALTEAGKLSILELQQKVGKDVAKIGMGNCMKNKWVKKDGADLVPTKKANEVEDTIQASLQKLVDTNGDTGAVDSKVRRCNGSAIGLKKISASHLSFSPYLLASGPRRSETT